MKIKKSTPIIAILILNLIFPNIILSQERLAVMNLKASGEIKQELSNTISVEIRNEIHKLGIYEVISQEDINDLAQRTATLQRIGCEKDNQCLILFGNQLDSRFMVAGSLAKLKDKYNLSVRLLDTVGKDAGVKARSSRTCSCSEDELLNIARVIGVDLIHNYYKGNPPEKDASEIAKDMHETKVKSLETALGQIKEDNVIDEDRSFIARNKWWILGGLVIVAGGAAAASGGGGGGSTANTDTSSQPAGQAGGEITFGW